MAQHKPHKRRQQGQGQRAEAHGRGIDTGKPGDEVLRPGLVRACVLHQLQNARHRGLPEFLRGLHPQHARQVDAAADDLVARLHVARQALARERGGVHGRFAVEDHAVDGDALAGLDHDDAADRHLIRVDLRKLALHLEVGVVRADVHQRGDAAAAAADGDALEELADLVEEHDRDGLVEVAAALLDGQGDRAERRHRHQEVFVKDLPVFDAQRGLAQDVPADAEIGGGIQHTSRPERQRQEIDQQQQRRRDHDAPEHLFLFPVHRITSNLMAPLQRRAAGIT